ncbi:MAG TPA: winged helix-turn-helix domain-containing protein [Dongiaceae bacterium]|nr:winged helix-turn-helix domain-containing protein [Dongiaceae bacterium]
MTSSAPAERYVFGPFEADLATHELWRGGVKLKLGGQPFEILAVLVRRSGQMVTREELQREIWGQDTFVDFDHGLNAAMNKLRETLSDSAESPRYIETLPRRGYRFIAAVQPVAAAPPAPAPSVAAPSAAAPPPPAAAAETRHPRGASGAGWQMGKPVAIAGFALAVLLIFLAVHRPVDREKEEAEARAKAGKSLSPMVTLVPDPASDPAISPDGQWVAFRRNSYTPGAAGIFVVGRDGETRAQITNNPGDSNPAWSPDGKYLAFSRISTFEYGIYVVPAAGGTPKSICRDPRKKRGELAWTPDGKFIAYSGDSTSGGAQIFLISVENSSIEPLTQPPGQDRDWGPAFSPDGKRLAFVRGNGAGFPEEIFVAAANGGEAQQLTTQRGAIIGPPAWSEDGRTIFFASTRDGDPALWKIASAGGPAERVRGTGDSTWHPSIAAKTGTLVVQKITRASGISRLDLPSDAKQHSQTTIITATNGRNEGPQPSPDGKRLAFMSDRAGSLEIWVSDADGSHATQLTNLDSCGTPRWSPDGKWIVFDATAAGRVNVYVVSASGGKPRALLSDDFANAVPSWSRDGNWIYFSSNRSGQDEVWKVRAEGGTPAKVTTNGGFAAWELPDGSLVYAKTRFDNTELWRVSPNGNDESRYAAGLKTKTWASWGVSNSGIYFIPAEGQSRGTTLDFYDFETQLTRQVSLLDRSPFWLSATPAGNTLYFNRAEDDESSVLLVNSYQ